MKPCSCPTKPGLPPSTGATALIWWAADPGITPSALSQHIKALQERAGTLADPARRPLATATGLTLVRHVEQVALLEHALAADLPGQDPQRMLLAVNADSLAPRAMPALAAVQGDCSIW